LGIRAAISSRDRNCASMPLSRIALPRRIAASYRRRVRGSAPALYITLKFAPRQLHSELVEVCVRVEVVVRRTIVVLSVFRRPASPFRARRCCGCRARSPGNKRWRANPPRR
jgi:hypothetical protein